LSRANAASLRVAYLGELSTNWSDSSSGKLHRYVFKRIEVVLF